MRATGHLRRGTWARAEASDIVRLDHDARHRRRLLMRTQAGREVLLDLPHAVNLRDGDALSAEDGTLIAVEAIAEPVIEVAACNETLLRIAWHIGNRHVPVQFLPGALRLRRDHVLAAMIEKLGGRVVNFEAPFDPEPGAYETHDHG